MSDFSWAQWLAAEATARDEAGLTRRLVTHGADDAAVDLAGNDYLGLARHPEVIEGAVRAARQYGGSAGASRLVSGTLEIHAELEAALADYTAQPSALAFSTGYHANLSVVTALADRDGLVVSDAHIHASLVDAARLSRAEVVITPHSDVAAVEAALASAGPGRRALVLAESVYSVLSDAAPLADLAALCASYGALLVVDEAHGLGVHGPGLVAAAGLAGAEHVVVTATLSKALGSQGGAVLGSPALREHLVNRARPFIFDTGLAPASAGAALAALGVLRRTPDLPARVHARSGDLAAALGVERPAGAVVSVPMPSPRVAVEAKAAALEQGVRVGCFRPPSVPDGISRLRVTTSAGPSEDDWRRAVDVLVAVVKEVGA